MKLFNKIFKRKNKKEEAFKDFGLNNVVSVGEKNNLKGSVAGNNNKIIIEDASQYGHTFNFNIIISGNNNEITIKTPYNVNNLNIFIGNHGEISNSTIYIDELTSIGDASIYVFQHNSNLKIGKNCTISKEIQFRTGEYPHLIFDKNTGEYLDKYSNIIIGDHVWIGEGCTLLKKAVIANNSIIGCYSVVTKQFTEEYVVIAGNPAEIRKRNIDFIRNELFLEPNSKYYKSFKSYQDFYGGKYIGNETKNK